MTKYTFAGKSKALFRGKRSFSKRLLLAAGPAFALSFTLFFFGPLDLACISRYDITYSPLFLVPVTALIMGIVFLVLLSAAAIPGGRIHAFLVSVYTGIAAAVYIQGAFLNPDLGALDGHTVIWTDLCKVMCINLAVWFLILLIPHLIHYFSNRTWRHFTMIVSVVLILMQTVSLSVKLADQIRFDRKNPQDYFLSKENMFTLGKEKNVIVFLLDTVSDRDIESTKETYPDILYQFRDFTCFDNANSQFMFTFPSMLDMLTANDPAMTVFDRIDYTEQAWQNPAADAFYSELRKNNFSTNFYLPEQDITLDLGSLQPYLSNIQNYNNDYMIDRSGLLNLYKLSMYRYLLIAAKPFFNIYSTDISQVITNPNAIHDQDDFVRDFNKTELSIGTKENVFDFFYLQGSHQPYYLNEKGIIQGDLEHRRSTTNMIDQTAGFLNLIGLYLWQMKVNEVYDDSLIIILADHGTNSDLSYDPQPIFWIKMPQQSHESMVISHAPINIQTEFMATIAQSLGLTNYDYGKSVFDIEDIPTDRFTRIYEYNDAYPPSGSRNNVVCEYHYVGDGDDLIKAFSNKDPIIYPITNEYFLDRDFSVSTAGS